MSSRLKIVSIKARALPPHEKHLSDPRKNWFAKTRIANPMSVFPKYADERSLWQSPFGDVLVAIETDSSVTGYAVGTGGAPAAQIIEGHFGRLLVGADPFDVGRLWEEMYRASLPYGGKGLPIMALSAVDIALWDIVAKAKEEPLYRLLGGRAKDRLPVYVTGNDIDRTMNRGYLGHKLAMPYAPADGEAGMDMNEALVAETRKKLGPGPQIMLDCYMAWNVAYTVRMAERLRPYRVTWIEESLPPEDVEGYAELRRKVHPTLIATGEHEYTRYGHRDLLVSKAVDILQPDVAWVGGITESLRIAAMASAFHVPFVPHAGGIQPWAVHMMFADVNAPFAEYVPELHGPGESHWWSAHEERDGCLIVSDEPGVGLRLDGEVVAELLGNPS